MPVTRLDPFFSPDVHRFDAVCGLALGFLYSMTVLEMMMKVWSFIRDKTETGGWTYGMRGRGRGEHGRGASKRRQERQRRRLPARRHDLLTFLFPSPPFLPFSSSPTHPIFFLVSAGTLAAGSRRIVAASRTVRLRNSPKCTAAGVHRGVCLRGNRAILTAGCRQDQGFSTDEPPRNKTTNTV